ncbi:MAG: hypothetical protein MUF51_02445, partial [Vicinamibacteria bacterium]|nr:hypothetical protein [Vicinamibacteria bacterium]
QIEKQEASLRATEERMAAPGFYDDRAAAADVVAHHALLKEEIAKLMERWETIHDEIETLMAPTSSSTRVRQ